MHRRQEWDDALQDAEQEGQQPADDQRQAEERVHTGEGDVEYNGQTCRQACDQEHPGDPHEAE